MKTVSWALASVASLALAACGANSINTDGTTGGAGSGTTTGGAGTTTGGPIGAAPVQPGDVVGVGVNDIFPDVVLNGGAITNFSTTMTPDCGPKPSGTSDKDCGQSKDCCTQNSPNFVSQFAFHDLYQQGNAAGMRYAFVDISGAWCIHCQQEATDLPTGYVADWLKQGGVVFSILVQDASSSSPCTLDTFFGWINHYQTNYPMSIDSEENLVFATALKAWPGNIIIRLSDMRVMKTVLGADSSFYGYFTKQLTQCQGDGSPNDCYAGSTCQSGTCVAN